MRQMRHLRNWALGLALTAAAASPADMVSVSAMHVGGFFDGGGADNKIEHQNYFVGYGTVGGVRTAERRSFFWFHIPEIDGEILSAMLLLKLPFKESLIFGKGPGIPGVDPIADDPFETFSLGITTTPAMMMVKPDLTADEGKAIFDAMDDHPVAPDKTFVKDGTLVMPMAVEMFLDGSGLAALHSHEGGDLVLTGWMPSWSHDTRLAPGTTKFFEADELIFGLTDIPGIVSAPELVIEFAPVPEASTALGLGALSARLLRRRRR